MTNLTPKQKLVLEAFPGGAAASGVLGQSFTDVAELAEATGLSQRSVMGVLAHLSNKGLIDTDGEGGERDELVLQSLTEEGCALLAEAEAPAAEAQPEIPVETPAGEEAQPVTTFTTRRAPATEAPAPAPTTEAPATKGVTNGQWLKLIWVAGTKCFISVYMPGGVVWVDLPKMSMQRLLLDLGKDSVDFENLSTDNPMEWRFAPIATT